MNTVEKIIQSPALPWNDINLFNNGISTIIMLLLEHKNLSHCLLLATENKTTQIFSLNVVGVGDITQVARVSQTK